MLNTRKSDISVLSHLSLSKKIGAIGVLILLLLTTLAGVSVWTACRLYESFAAYSDNVEVRNAAANGVAAAHSMRVNIHEYLRNPDTKLIEEHKPSVICLRSAFDLLDEFNLNLICFYYSELGF